MPQFIVIDHSIQDTTGHHYEYALRVAEAAAKAGYTPVLGVNVHFETEQKVPWVVHPVYRYGFWPRMATTSGSKIATNFASKMANGLRLAHLRFIFSQWGFLYLFRDGPIGYLKWHPFDSPVSTAVLVTAGVVYLPVRMVMLVLTTLVPFRSYFANIFKTAWNLVKNTAIQVFEALSPQGPLDRWRFLRRKRKSFGEDTLRLLKKLKLSPDDLIFIPTLSESEMLGLMQCFRRSKDASIPSYHLIFRRNLYEGREPEFDAQENNLLNIRNAFLEFHAGLSGQRVFFYTDTEELTKQYNRLGVFPFGICPIPHTVPASEHKPSELPLRVTYLGDARAEKGYQHLPGVVQDLWPAEVASGHVSFVFQSNYNVRPGEPEAIVARSRLSSYPRDKVRLLTESCSSEQYRELLVSADIMVLPYREDLYYARSSGVVIEALAAGVPVVVPATSWLAKQIADPVYRYLANLAGSGKDVSAKRRPWYRETGHTHHELSLLQDGLTVGGENRKIYTWQTRPSAAKAVLVSFEFGKGDGEFITCYVDQVDAYGNRVDFRQEMRGPGYRERAAWLAIPLHPAAKKIWIGLRNSFSDTLIYLQNASVHFVGALLEGEAVPLSSVGVMFTPDGSGAVANGLREVLRHYEHYRDSARAFSDQVYRVHNAENLIRTLVSTANSNGAGE